MKKLSLLLSIVLLFSNFICAYNTVMDQRIKAKYAVLRDFNTGEVIYQKNADVASPPSSMSKLMTSYLVFEKLKDGILKLDDDILISQEAWSKGGSKMFVMVGSKVKLSELILGMIVQSGNDATIALAEAVSGSEAMFANLMNQKAIELGLKNSSFVNATGWPDPGQMMSVYDLSELGIRLIKDFPQYYHYFSLKEYSYNNIIQQNRNSLLSKSNFNVDGLKTGKTDIGGYGIVSSAIKGSRRLVAVVNGLSSDNERVSDVNELFAYGFNSYTNILVAKSAQVLKTVPIKDGKEKTIPLKSHSDILLTIDNNKISDLKVELVYNEPIAAPVKKGDILASLIVYHSGSEISKFYIYSDRDYDSCSWFSKLLNKIF